MIPTAVLRQRITIDAYTGTGGNGMPTYGGDQLTAVPARIVRKARQVVTSVGVDIVADATVQVRPLADDLAPLSLITDEQTGDVWTVLATALAFDLTRPHHHDVFVEGPRPVAA